MIHKHGIPMLIRKSYKFRLKVTPDIEKQFLVFSECCRFVWNKALRICLNRLEKRRKILRYYELSFWLQLWKQSNEYGFIGECSYDALQQKLRDLDRAFKDAFDKNQPNKRLPKMKKERVCVSFRIPKDIKIKDRRIYIPKIGWVGFFKSRVIEGFPKNATIFKEGNHWFVSIQVEQKVKTSSHPFADKELGIHLGVNHFLTTTEGEQLAHPQPYARHLRKLKKLQRELSRKQEFSKNREKCLQKLRKLRRKEAHIRQDYLHKISTKMSNEFGTIFVTDLRPKKLYRYNTKHIKNKGIALNRRIIDQGWHEFMCQLDYKLKWKGGILIKVLPMNMRLTCSNCQSLMKKQPTTNEEFKCSQCGFKDLATLNVAHNVRAAGQTVLACGEKA